MIKMKYIMFEQTIGEDGDKHRVPVIFFEPLTHIETYEQMSRSTDLLPNAKLVSAGFVQFSGTGAGLVGVFCYGESESLKHRKLPHVPLDEDAEVIRHYNYVHGLMH